MELVDLHFDQTLNIFCFKQEIDCQLIIASFFEDAQARLFDIFISDEQKVAQEGQTPSVEIEIALTVELTICLDDALGEGWRALG